MKRILIVGSTGMLGRTVKKFFSKNGYDVVTLDRRDIDLSKCGYNQLKFQIENKKCNILINCSGLIIQRKETSVDDFLHVNTIIPLWISKICENIDVKMFHPTTDCVFDGLNGPYEEESDHTEKGIYGLSKSLGEPSNCCVIRSSIIGEEKHNKLSFLEWVRSNSGKTVNGYTNHLWNGVTCLEMAKIIKEIIDGETYYKGIKHWFSPTVSKYVMVNYINKVYNLGIIVNGVSTGDIINKTLISKYTECRKDLLEQIKEQKDFWNE